MSPQQYINEISKLFEANADPATAAPMKKYMKNLFEYYGIKTPVRHEVTKPYLLKSSLPPIEDLETIVKLCWEKPQREFQYFAQMFAGKYMMQLDESHVELMEYMITSKSWWDTVDYVAGNLVGALFQNRPELIPVKTGEWMNSGNMWLQRTCLLFQLKYKSNTDTELLFGFIRRLNTSREFFIRKAIGWALREYSKTDPNTVIKFVESTELSGLSRREALKVVNKK